MMEIIQQNPIGTVAAVLIIALVVLFVWIGRKGSKVQPPLTKPQYLNRSPLPPPPDDDDIPTIEVNRETHQGGPNHVMNEINAGTIEVPVRIKSGRRSFLITEENMRGMTLGVLFATDEVWDAERKKVWMQ